VFTGEVEVNEVDANVESSVVFSLNKIEVSV
jgi:hypothetical protein